MNLAWASALLAGTTLLIGCGSGKSTGQRSPAPTPPPALQTSLAVATADATIAAQYGPPAVKVAESRDGRRILTDLSGKTLYVYRADVPASGISRCTGGCASAWPPLTVPYGTGFQIPGLGLFGEFRRDDGDRQIMYRGRPLYRYAGDKTPGDTNGDGVDGRWSVAVP